TVMVVSFVNAGLLTLVESIGLIMGANLGTTLTAWIIAVVGKFSISDIAIPIIGIGLPLIFIGKSRWRSFGEALIGFGLLFFGLALLKDAVPDVQGMLKSTDPAVQEQARDIQAFIASLSGKGFLSVLIFLALGVGLTICVQSSSAAMAITITLAMQGWIGLEESAAIVLGENIGTTITAWLASIGTAVNAKRAARAHFLFNVIGVCWMLLVFGFFVRGVVWLADLLPDSARGSSHNSEIGFQLAIFHSSFNFVNICLLVGFVPVLAKIVTRIVKEPAGGEEPAHRLRFISGGMLDIGELNIPEAENATRELAGITRTMFTGCMEVFRHPHTDLTDEVKRLKAMEDAADILTHDITEYLVRTSSAEISPENARAVSRMLRIAAELEEITDAIYRLIQATKRRYTKGRVLSEENTAGTLELAARVSEMIDLYSEILASQATAAKLRRAEELERAIAKLRKQQNKQATVRMTAAPESVKAELITIDLNNQLDMIASHGLNVIQSAYYLVAHDEVPETRRVPV
ncbi:MAG: Na/Pi symporter, partial [Akkermansiaceae bacterium]|nr:Na/Pi symporter [Akkermansiaceae bacterium]